ncbi:hypothetical protein GTP38_11565 [Duganella sp. FT94W]|uniref:Uncharacterized protein n=1 Tax=Duganella lactea TaxID=2692173 RepID=A0ABW9V8G4_9BURK|nr:hypothetical protein [Duganella lactea]MYM34973.1 hypothetical protein [Duganella lactea]
MSFWDELPSLIGPSDKIVYLEDSFALPANEKNVQGPKWACAYYEYGGITIAHPRHGEDHERVQLYWLPWSNGEITKVTMEQLKYSRCDYFLTSTFSGCRFVETDTLVAHVAYHQRGHSSDSTGRDISEWNRLHGRVPPKLRRAMSFSNGGTAMTFGESSLVSYGNGAPDKDTYSKSRAVVIGYKTGETWNFVRLVYTQGDTRGVWSRFS